MKKSINVLLHGELGNQLFQMALCINLAIKNQVKIRIFNLNPLNPYRLSEYDIGSNLLINRKNLIQKLSNYLFLVQNRFDTSKSFFPLIREIMKKMISLRYGKIYSEKISHSYDPNIFKVNLPLTVDGYFQSWRYFSDIKIEIQKAYSIKNLSHEASRLFEELPAKFTGVHIRRGNSGPSILNKTFHGLLPTDYYLRAIKFLRDRSKLFPIVVFTDNKPECEEFLKCISDLNVEIYSVVTALEIRSQAENLYIMSKSTSFIGANSSYSWWAAYLNENERADIVFPRPWYKNPGSSDQELLLPDWFTLGFDSFMN